MIKNKKIFITGCTSGLGLALLENLSRFDNKIFTLGKRKVKKKKIKSLICNFKNLKNLNNKLESLITNKKLDYVILNAGVLGNIKKINEIDLSEVEKIFKINFFANKKIIDYLINNKIKVKVVVSISSGAALEPKVGWYSYCASKSALKFLIDSYAKEFPRIKFFNVAPGLIKTKMQLQISKVNAKKIKSVKKFQNLYKKNLIPSPKEVSLKLIKLLPSLNKITSGSFIDLRDKKYN